MTNRLLCGFKLKAIWGVTKNAIVKFIVDSIESQWAGHTGHFIAEALSSSFSRCNEVFNGP